MSVQIDGAGVDWIAVDWGTSKLRAWGLAGDAVVRHARSDQGMGVLTRNGYEPALLALITEWLLPAQTTPVFVCGMAGSRQGWVEAPYRPVPCAPLAQDGGAVIAPSHDPRITVRVIPGLKQSRPADVIRGEETQIAGYLARHPGWDGVLCLPGTHSKWVHLSAGEVVSFQTFLTGELFALLAGHSVLRHSVRGWDDSAFIDGVRAAMDHPERLAARLFAIRAESLIADLSPAAARARLSGLLIGAELAATRPYWLGQRVAIVAAPELGERYAAALDEMAVPVRHVDATEMTLAGLARVHAAQADRANSIRNGGAMRCAH